MEDIIWHEIHNAYRTRRMLSGMLSGIERTEAGKTIAIVDYKGIPACDPLEGDGAGLPGRYVRC